MNISSIGNRNEPPDSKSLELMANAIRVLSMDAVQKAKSGHPGMPMGMADVASVLFSKHIKINPADPEWFDRDRFILSGGHGSMLLYSLSHLLGFKEMSLTEIKNFRQLGSKTPGHPEYNPKIGVETTTGPLGQGLAMSVGFAIAERHLNARFGDDFVNHYTYVTAGDGDLQEGISHESCSLAGHLGLGKLIVMFDDNEISIDGKTVLSASDDISARFNAYSWEVIDIDGHDFDQIDNALTQAKSNTQKPTLIRCKTIIGKGAPNKQGSHSVHGSPLGEDEILQAKQAMGWASQEPFYIPEEILMLWRTAGLRSKEQYEIHTINQGKAPKEFKDICHGNFLPDLDNIIKELKNDFISNSSEIATRKTSGKCLDKIFPNIPSMIGGSADLTGSVNTYVNDTEILSKDNYAGRYIHYGIREHAMAAAMNGMALHGGIIPYSGTFLQFSDYCRPAIRLSSLMEQRVIYVMTHDSIGLGEDGPTHQPIEHLSSLRAIPGLYVFRPCDGIETAESWELALSMKNRPSVLSLCRQNLPALRTCKSESENAENLTAKGAYILCSSEKDIPDLTLFASGSEVSIAKQAFDELADDYNIRLVSVPCMDLFFEQDINYIRSLTENAGIKIAVEAGVRQSWDGIIGTDGIFIGMNGFGDSAPAEKLYENFGITAEEIIRKIHGRVEKKRVVSFI